MKRFSGVTKAEFLTVIKNYYDGINDIGHITHADEMLEFAILHQLNTLFYHMVLSGKDTAPYDRSFMMQSYLMSAQVNMTQTRESDKFSAYLRDKGVPHSYIKGQFIKDYYTPSELRSMGDSDIYIPVGYLDIAKDYFEANGYEFTEYYEHVTTYTKNKVSFEVHDRIEWFGVDWAEPLEGYGYGIKTQLKYAIIHAIKHIVGFGLGVRQVLDIALLLRADSTLLDDSDFLADIDKIHVTKCYHALIGVINRWFGTSYPCEADESAVNVLAMSILDGGVFGKNLNDYATINTVQNKTKGKMYLRAIFPKYERMVMSYPKLEGKKYLLPYYYIKRLIDRGIKEKRYKRISSDGADASMIDNRRHFMEILDLEDQHYNKF